VRRHNINCCVLLFVRHPIILFPVAIRQCSVSFVGPTGVRHSIDVTAETLYEAAATASAAMNKEEWSEPIAPGTPIEIQVREPATTHTLSIAQIRHWCDGIAVSPDEVLRRQRVKSLVG
jgi:hypothetical protein